MKRKEKKLIELVQRYQRPLYFYALNYLGRPSEAEEVVQECFLALWQQDTQKLGSYAKAWLYFVCRNKCLDRLKRKSSRNEVSFAAATDAALHQLGLSIAPEGEQHLQSQEDRRATALAIKQLPSMQKEIVTLKFEGHLSNSEIAKVLNTSKGSVAVSLFKAVKKLQEYLEEQSRERAGLPRTEKIAKGGKTNE